jgi:hypothetical protein
MDPAIAARADGTHRFQAYRQVQGGTKMIEEQRHSLVGLALAVAVGIVLGGLAIAAVFAVLAAVIHLLGWLV